MIFDPQMIASGANTSSSINSTISSLSYKKASPYKYLQFDTGIDPLRARNPNAGLTPATVNIGYKEDRSWHKTVGDFFKDWSSAESLVGGIIGGSGLSSIDTNSNKGMESTGGSPNVSNTPIGNSMATDMEKDMGNARGISKYTLQIPTMNEKLSGGNMNTMYNNNALGDFSGGLSQPPNNTFNSLYTNKTMTNNIFSDNNGMGANLVGNNPYKIGTSFKF